MKYIFFTILLIPFTACKTDSNKTAPTPPEGMVYVPETKITDGTSRNSRETWVLGNFFMDISPVTVAEFENFTIKTHYKTEAEKFGNAGVLTEKGAWKLIDGADFRYPQGKQKPAAEANHPVTQVSYNDALAYAQWAGKRLPTRAEWEYSAMNADPNYKETYSWGNDWKDKAGKFKVNFWQGAFPFVNTVEDGFALTSPVGYFGKNKLGLTDMGGNVWQWVTDWKDPSVTDPVHGERVHCGGSFLCDPSVCHGFKIGNTASATMETSLFHVGFRCVK